MFGEYFIFLLILDDDATGIRQVILPTNSQCEFTSTASSSRRACRLGRQHQPVVVPGLVQCQPRAQPVERALEARGCVLRNQNRSIGRAVTAEFDCRALNSIAPPSDSNSRSGGPEARALPLSHRNKPRSAKILAELMRSYACASVCTLTKRVLNVWGIQLVSLSADIFPKHSFFRFPIHLLA